MTLFFYFMKVIISYSHTPKMCSMAYIFLINYLNKLKIMIFFTSWDNINCETQKFVVSYHYHHPYKPKTMNI